MNKKQKFKRTALIFSLLAIAIFLFAGGGNLFSVVQIPISWNFYGESDAVITNLALVSQTGSSGCNGGCSITTKRWSSTYWDIMTISQGATIGFGDTNAPVVNVIGDDGDIHLDGGAGQGASVTSTLQTTNTFGKGKDFRVQVPTGNYKFALSNVDISEERPPNSIDLGCLQQTCIYEIKESSPILGVDDVNVYWNGGFLRTETHATPFKVLIRAYSNGWAVRNSAYKDAFNCVVKPDEQYYKKYFMEGSSVSKSALENFNHWCLEDAPLEIYTNSGKTTDRMVIVALENGNVYPVPAGQIYAIEYIGDKKQLVTPCEQDEVLLNGNECKARTVLELQFICQGGTLNTATGECIPSSSNESGGGIVLQTQAVDYIKSDLQTYQFLAENSKFRFTVIQDDNTITANSFDLFGQTFMSEIPSSFSSASFSWGDKSGTLLVGEVMPLDERLKVRLSRVELQALEDVSVGDTQKFLVEWTFELDTRFLVPSYDASKKEIKINNSYYPFTGGVSITKWKSLGVLPPETERAEFLLGETRIPIDTSGLLQFSVRPFIEIITPDAEFRLATSIPMTVSDLQETQAIVTVPTQPTTRQIVPLEKTPEGGKGEISAQKTGLSFGIIAGIIGGILVGLGMMYFIIRSLIKMRRKR